jgi:hypothetical protein
MTRDRAIVTIAVAAGAAAALLLPPSSARRTSRTSDVRRTARASSPTTRAPIAGRRTPRLTPVATPLLFEKNVGQMDPRVEFLLRGPGYEVYLTDAGARWTLASSRHHERRAAQRARAADLHTAPRLGTAPQAHEQVDVVRMTLVGARTHAIATGVDEQAARVRYYRGSDPSQSRVDTPTFSRVRVAGVYPGIDMEYYGRSGDLEYDFVVAPGSDPAAIELAVDGAGEVTVDASGDLLIDTPGGRIVQRRPVSYQEQHGVRHPVASRYVLAGNGRIGLDVGPYDQRQPLVIDPVLALSTFIGGTGGTYGEQAYGVATDAGDNVYITGITRSAVFPVDGGPVQDDLFVVKMAPDGTVGYVTVINGNGNDSGEGITVDANGNAIVVGFTDSTNFPTLNPIRTDQTSRDGILFKLDPEGVIVYSTYLGGNSSFDYAESVVTDPAGNAYVTGVTQSSNVPLLNPRQSTNAGQDVFVVKVDPMGNLQYGTYLGGSGSDGAEGITIDAAGYFYVTGWTNSSNFPLVASTDVKKGTEDVFVTEFTPDGRGLVYSRYLGGTSNERAYAILADGMGGVWVAGQTDSADFPTLFGLQANQPGTDAFLTRLDATGTVAFSTYVGGNGFERALGLSTRDDVVYVAGQTLSTDMPVLGGPQMTGGGSSNPDAFVLALDTVSYTRRFSTYLGGSATDDGRGVAALAGGNVYVAGWTESANFPVVRATQATKSNRGNAFIARLAPVGINAVSPALSAANGGTEITITGSAFAPGAAVLIDDAAATNVVVVDSSTIRATTPAHATGTANATVVNPGGDSGTLYNALTVVNGTAPLADAGPDQFVDATSAAGAVVALNASGSFDPNGDPLTYQWSDENGVTLATGRLANVLLGLGTHDITLTVSDGHSPAGIDTVRVRVADTTPPAVAVVTPNGADRLYTGTPTTIEWTATDAVSGVASFDVYLSADGGVTYGATPICAAVSGTQRNCTWTAPSPVTSKARLRVVARDNAGNSAFDVSNANFSVLTGTATIMVSSPNTNVNWGAGSTQQIKWKHNLGTAASTRLEASYDGGVTWTLIADAVKNTASGSSVFNWTLPNRLSTNARIRATWTNGPTSDTSDTSFTIAAPYITLASPGTSWGYGTSRAQTWTTNLGPLDKVDVLLSTDGATFPITLGDEVVASGRSVTFTTPTLGASTTVARARAVWTNAPPGFSAQGTSATAFRIEPPFVTLTAPIASTIWTVGTAQVVRWSDNLGSRESVSLELSTDDGATYGFPLVASTPSDAREAVTVPAASATSQGRVRITWLKSGAVTHVSPRFVIH